MENKKWEIHTIKKVVATDKYELICTFENNIVKAFDFKPLLKKKGTMLEPLRSVDYFKKVFLEMGVPTWPNGYDVCADVIFRDGKSVKQLKKPAA
jgi:hypothetical protein